MNEDEARAALARALGHPPIEARYMRPDQPGKGQDGDVCGGCTQMWPCPYVRMTADLVLPVVRHLAAEELRTAAASLPMNPLPWQASHILTAHAAALDTPDHGKA